MKIKLVKIESNHTRTEEALQREFDEIVLNNTSMTIIDSITGFYLRTSSIKEITIKTNNSTYTLERVEENK